MQAAELSDLWQQRWGETRPLFGELKAQHPSFRVRTLPYLFPQNDDDFAALLERFHVVLAELGERLIVIVPEYDPTDAHFAVEPPELAESWFWQDVVTDAAEYHLWVSELYADDDAEVLDGMLCDIADENTGSVILADSTLSVLVYPVPGGADIVCADPAENDRLRSLFADWLA